MAESVNVGIVIGAAVGSSVGRAFGSVAERSRQVGDALHRTNQRADRHRQELRRLRAEQARTGDDSGQLAREIRRVGEVLRRTTERAGAYRRELRELQRLDAARTSARGALVRGGALFGAVYGVQRLIGDAGIAHERAAAELRTVVQTDAEVVRALEHARRRVRGGAGTDETEQVQIHYELSSAGFSAEEARIGSVIAEQVAIATRGVPDETAKTIGTAYNLFREKLTGTTEENLRRVGDVLTQTQFTFQLSNLGALSAGFAEATKGAQQMNVGLEETATLVGLLNTLGLTDSRAGTSYNAIMRQLVPASRMLGFEIVRANDGGLDLAATLEGLAAVLPEDTDRRAAVVQKAFGEEGAAVSLLLPKLDLYREGLDGANDALGVTEEAWARILATTGERLGLLKRRADVARNAIGEALQAPIGDTTDRLGDVANWIGEAAEESPQLIRDLGTIALGIGGVVAASIAAAGTRWVVLSLVQGYRDLGWMVKGAAGRLGRFAGALGRLSGVTRLAAAVQWLWNAALLANPIGATVALVVAGAALIGGAVYLVYKHWEPIKEWFGNILGAVGEQFGPILDAWEGGLDRLLLAGGRRGHHQVHRRRCRRQREAAVGWHHVGVRQGARPAAVLRRPRGAAVAAHRVRRGDPAHHRRRGQPRRA